MYRNLGTFYLLHRKKNDNWSPHLIISSRILMVRHLKVCIQKQVFLFLLLMVTGVLWNQSHPIPGSAEGLRFLQGLGKKLAFITNNSMCPEQQIIDKLHEQNIEIEAVNIPQNKRTLNFVFS